MAFVGDLDIQGGWTGTTVGDAYYDGTHWYVEYDHNKGWDDDFKDITTTDGLVVAVGMRDIPSEYFLKVWKQDQHFLSISLPINYTVISTSGVIMDPLCITHLNGDTLAVSYSRNNQFMYYMSMDIWEYSSQINSVSSFEFDIGVKPSLYALSYDMVYQNILLSFRMTLPPPITQNFYVLGSVWNYVSPTSMIIYHYWDNGPYHCVCGDGLGGYQSSGIYMDTIGNRIFDMFYLSGIYINNCAEEVNQEVVRIYLPHTNMTRGTTPFSVSVLENFVPKTIYQSPLIPHCYNHH